MSLFSARLSCDLGVGEGEGIVSSGGHSELNSNKLGAFVWPEDCNDIRERYENACNLGNIVRNESESEDAQEHRHVLYVA